MKKLFVFLLSILSFSAFAKHKDTRVFELRVYTAADGKLDNLIERFQNHTTAIFKKHGMTNIGYWLPINNTKNQIIYVLAYPSMAAREASWKAFSEDEEWKKVAATSEVNGKIVIKVESTFMNATDFSPKIKSSNKGDRVFELRTYFPAAGKVSNILARFREHTVALFTKHGIQNIAYFTSIEKDNKQPVLIYLLAHKSEEAGKKSFEEFGKDPDWVKVKTESEKDGKIVDSIQSVYMKPLPFSKIK